MLITFIDAYLVYLLLLGRCFCDLSETASAFDFANEWILYTADCNKFRRSLDVRLPSIGCKKERFLIARLMVFCWIRVMDTVLNTRHTPNPNRNRRFDVESNRIRMDSNSVGLRFGGFEIRWVRDSIGFEFANPRFVRV